MQRCHNTPNKWGALAFACLLMGCTAPPAPSINAPHLWTDSDGRTVLHRGMNLNNQAKRASDGYTHGRSTTELAHLVSHGFTAIRLLTFWEAVEPERGVYDEAYLDQLRSDIAALEALGLDVIVDLHQDVYGEGFSSTGFPDWTCAAENYENFVASEVDWFFNYFNQGVLDCFDNFWADDALQADYAAMTAHLVNAVHESPAVVAIDVINEPFWGTMSIEDHETLTLPRFYETVVETVREVDEDIRIWLAPSAGSNITYEALLDLDALRTSAPIASAPHFYPPNIEVDAPYDDDFTEEAYILDGLADHANDYGVPLVVGEFGIWTDYGNESDYVQNVLRHIEARGNHSFYWSYDAGSRVLNDDGSPGSLLEAYLAPFPHRIPGVFSHVDLDGTAHFDLSGMGELVFMTPQGAGDCEIEGADVLSLDFQAPRLTAQLEGDGPVSALCW